SRVRLVNVRVLSATNADLADEVAQGRFREDVLYRLNTVHIHLPPLRDRLEDLEPLAAHFLEHHARRHDKPITGLDAEAWRALRAHRWPGNIRELAHGIERAVLFADRGATALRARDLSLGITTGARTQEMSLEEAERLFIEKALARHNGDVRAAAV